jgi:hypothetical protein
VNEWAYFQVSNDTFAFCAPQLSGTMLDHNNVHCEDATAIVFYFGAEVRLHDTHTYTHSHTHTSAWSLAKRGVCVGEEVCVCVRERERERERGEEGACACCPSSPSFAVPATYRDSHTQTHKGDA